MCLQAYQTYYDDTLRLAVVRTVRREMRNPAQFHSRISAPRNFVRALFCD